jgi:hypothetical protein
VSPGYSRSFAPEIRYFFLQYAKYACEKLPFSDEKSRAESSPPIYVELPFSYHAFIIVEKCKEQFDLLVKTV